MKTINIFLFLVVIVLAVFGAYIMGARNIPKQTASIAGADAMPDPMKAQIPAGLTGQQRAELKAGSEPHTASELTFHVTGGSFYFTPNEIKVRQGDKVKIVFSNVLGVHNLTFDDPQIATKTIKTGETNTIEFIAGKKGSFEFYCNVGNGYHRMMGQIGVLLVQ